MKIELTIGKALPAQIILDDDSVSTSHASLCLTDEGEYIIRDRESKNGVYVNGRRVRQYQLSSTDNLRFGDFNITATGLKEKANPHLLKLRTDFSKEYREIITIMHEFEKEKHKILRPPLWPTLLRAVLIGGCLLYIGLNPKAIGQPLGLIMAVGVVVSVITLFANRSSKKQQNIDKLKLQYESILRCPKCSISLLSQSYTLLNGRSKCYNSKCDAIYTIGSIQTE